MKKIFIPALLILSVLATPSVYAEQKPRSVAADHRIKLINYDPNNVTSVKAHYGYETQIVFSNNEAIQNVTLGDSSAWQVIPVSNHLFLKPIIASTTNMTVLTISRSYNFHLSSANSSDPSDQTYELRFIYPDDAIYQQIGASPIKAQSSPYYNGEYSYTGDKKIAPIQAFDDGKFTYLKFRSDGSSVIPAIFSVDKDRNESLVNYHTQDGYIVINQVNNQYTLRNGNYVTSVYNDKAIGDWESVH